MGKKIVITEDLISKLIGYNGGGVRCIDMAERCSDVSSIAREIFTHGLPSSKIRDLKDHHGIWARIILGCINHRHPTSSLDYIHIDKQFLIYFIAKRTVVPQNLPSHFSSRNHSFRCFLIFQTSSRIGQTDFSRQSNKS